MVASLPNLSQLEVSEPGGVKRGIDQVTDNNELTLPNVKDKLIKGQVIYTTQPFTESIGVLSNTESAVDDNFAHKIWEGSSARPDANGTYNNVYFRSMPDVLYELHQRDSSIFPYRFPAWVAIRESKGKLQGAQLENAYLEVNLTMLAAAKGLGPIVYAAYIKETAGDKRLVMITEKGLVLSKHLPEITAGGRSKLADVAIWLCARCASNGLLLLDIKAENMIVVVSEKNTRLYMIDLDPQFTFLVPESDQTCAHFLMLLLLAINLRCYFNYKEMTNPILDVLLGQINAKCGDDFLGVLIRKKDTWEIGNPAANMPWRSVNAPTHMHGNKWALQAFSMLLWYLYHDKNNKTWTSICMKKEGVFSRQEERSVVGQLLQWLRRASP